MTEENWRFPFKQETLEKSVVVAFCTRGNDIYFGAFRWVLNQSNIFRKFSVFASQSLWGPGAEQLFTNVANFPCDYMMIIDTDVEPPLEAAVRMIERGRDVISCPTWMYDGGTRDVHLNVHYEDSMKRVYVPPQGGFQKVLSTSWACCLISHRVLATFVQTGEKFTEWSPLLKEMHRKVPPDTIFFLKCKELGFDVWMDWDLEFAVHHKYVALCAPTLEKFLKNRVFPLSEAEERERALALLARRQGALVG